MIPVYCATKAAVANFTAGMGVIFASQIKHLINIKYHKLMILIFILLKAEYHFKKHNIRVNAICPTATVSNIFKRIDETNLAPELWQSLKQAQQPTILE